VSTTGCWLVTGGAGYIGTHVARVLLEQGYRVVVLDDLSSGRAARIPDQVPLVQCSVQDEAAVTAALRDYGVDGVVHLAAKKAAGESVQQPLRYYRENVDGMISLLAAMQQAQVGRLVYSSSAAVYGTPARNPIDEDFALVPESPYGQTKVIGEWLAHDAGIATGLSWVALRYFNVAGAGDPSLGDTSVNNLIPMVFAALERGQAPQIFGDDYPTPDGTCIRDYIHVQDLADAHAAAVAFCMANRAADVFNVGRGIGSSVLEVMAMISDVLQRDIGSVVTARRPGDPPASTAATARIEQVLGWRAQRDLHDMVSSAWQAWQQDVPV
jgi:UDP-glucose 4-epimerase